MKIKSNSDIAISNTSKYGTYRNIKNIKTSSIQAYENIKNHNEVMGSRLAHGPMGPTQAANPVAVAPVAANPRPQPRPKAIVAPLKAQNMSKHTGICVKTGQTNWSPQMKK